MLRYQVVRHGMPFSFSDRFLLHSALPLCPQGDALSNADFRKLMMQPKVAGPANAAESGGGKKTKEYDSERRKKKR
jgi:hypothetical protein